MSKKVVNLRDKALNLRKKARNLSKKPVHALAPSPASAKRAARESGSPRSAAGEARRRTPPSRAMGGGLARLRGLRRRPPSPRPPSVAPGAARFPASGPRGRAPGGRLRRARILARTEANPKRANAGKRARRGELSFPRAFFTMATAHLTRAEHVIALTGKRNAPLTRRLRRFALASSG